MVADRSKKAKIQSVGEAEVNEQVDGELVLCIEKLQEVQDALEKINEEETEKLMKVEEQYDVVRRPIYDKRNEVIRTIPEFWLTAFLSHPALSDLLTEDDQKIFKYLQCLDVDEFKDEKSGYTVTFDFRPNPFFDNDKLSKTISFDDEGTTSVTATEIKWKKGMGVSNGTIQNGKGKKRASSKESFFTWFTEEELTCMPDASIDEVADMIKEDLWVNPLKYFHYDGDADEDDEDDDNGNTEDAEEDSSEDEDDDDN